MYNNNVKEPLYFHREYENDLPKQEPKMEGSSQALRVAKVALPFVALYRPFGSTLACGLSVARTVTSLRECFAAEDYQKLSWALFNTCLAVGSVAGTIFFHPLGMLIATLNDIGINIYHVYSAVSHGEMYEAGKQTVRVANNTLYLAMLILGSIELQLASLALQVLVEGSESYEEFNKGNILEMIGHLGMCMVRGSQSYAQLEMVQRKWTIASISQKVAVAKPCAGGKASSLEVACIKKDQWHPALGALREQHPSHLVYADLKVKYDGEICLLSSEVDFDLLPKVKAVGDSGDLLAVWLDADASGVSKDQLGNFETIERHFEGLDKFLYISQYNASTGAWSIPNGLAMPSENLENLNWSLLSADPFGNAVILLQNMNTEALEAISFDNIASKWLNPVKLANHLPNVTAFDSDALGNCTVAWSGKDNLFTHSSYDPKTKTWDLPVSFKHEQIEHVDLFVRRDLDGNIAILAKELYLKDEQVTYAHLFDGITQKWFSNTLTVEERLSNVISMGKGQFGVIFANENSISSFLLDASSGWENLGQIKSSLSDIDKIIVDKDRHGNPVVSWLESTDEEFRFDFDQNTPLEVKQNLIQQWADSTKIKVANFDPSKKNWSSTVVATGLININPKFGKAGGDLYLFWDEYCLPEGKLFPINFNGMKWEEETGKWNPLGTVFKCPMKGLPFPPFNTYYYTKSIHDDGLHVIWGDGNDYKKEITPLQ